MEASRFDDAETIYQKLVGLTPDRSHCAHAARHGAGDGWRDCRRDCARCARRCACAPTCLPAKLFLGISYMELGRPKEAVGPLRQVVQADKDNPNARQALAEALLTLEQYAEASAQLEALALSAAAVAAGVGRARSQLRRRGP